jgi:hypothetical protein
LPIGGSRWVTVVAKRMWLPMAALLLGAMLTVGPAAAQQITGVPGCVGFGPGRSYRDGYPG